MLRVPTEERQRRGLRLLKVLRILDDVFLHIVQVDRHAGQRPVFFLEIRELKTDGMCRYLLVEGFYALAVRLAQLGHHLDAGLQLLAEALDRGLDLFAFPLR